jgi:hypothetical protein
MELLSGLILMSLCPPGYKDINIKPDNNCISKESINTSISNLTEWHLKRGHKHINIKPDKNGISKEGIRTSISSLTRS